MDNPFRSVMIRRRSELGISQAQAAARAGVSRSTWNSWERVDDMPHMAKWQLIAKVLELQIDELERAVSTNWFLQCGPTKFQQDLLKAAGIQFDMVLPGHVFTVQSLHKLDRDLDVDLRRVLLPVLEKQLGTLRNQIRNALIIQDTAIQGLVELVKAFRSIYDLVAPRNYTPILSKKTPKVTKKPSPTGRRPRKSD